MKDKQFPIWVRVVALVVVMVGCLTLGYIIGGGELFSVEVAPAIVWG